MRFGISYFGNRMPWYVKEDLKMLKDAGFDVVVHTYSENDFRFYRETMRKIFKDTKQLGMEIWADPWGWGGIFGGEAFSGFLQDNPEETQVNNLGKREGSVCFLSEKFKNLMKEWIYENKQSGADAIFWDEPHYFIYYNEGEFPNKWTCRCEKCQKEFYNRFGYEMPVEYNEDIKKFRNDTATEFFKELSEYAKNIGLKNIVCFIPFENDLTGIYDFENISSLPSMDDIGSDPYWYGWNKPVSPFVDEVTEKIVNLSKKYGKKTHMWLQGFKVPKEREEELFEGYKIFERSGIDTVLFWGVYACKHISSIACEDSDKTWETILRIVNENKGK